jgi:hypothetical protein
MQLLFRLPFLLLEMLLRRSARVLADLVVLVRGGDADVVAEPAFAPEPAPAAAPEPAPAAAAPEAPPAPTGPPPPTADEALARRAAREAAEANGAGTPDIASARVRPLREGPHVDREAEVVESVGPADDVVATIEVDEPWEGYDAMPATAIVARLRDGDEATRAVVRLYEQRHKNRATVLRAT